MCKIYYICTYDHRCIHTHNLGSKGQTGEPFSSFTIKVPMTYAEVHYSLILSKYQYIIKSLRCINLIKEVW